jgi:hypothetical protein
MLRMLRFRGKRVWYLIFAAFATFLIFRWSHQPNPQAQTLDFSNPPKKHEDVESPPVKPPVKPPVTPLIKPTPPTVVEGPKETEKAPIAEVENAAPAKTREAQTSVVIPEST